MPIVFPNGTNNNTNNNNNAQNRPAPLRSGIGLSALLNKNGGGVARVGGRLIDSSSSSSTTTTTTATTSGKPQLGFIGGFKKPAIRQRPSEAEQLKGDDENANIDQDGAVISSASSSSGAAAGVKGGPVPPANGAANTKGLTIVGESGEAAADDALDGIKVEKTEPVVKDVVNRIPASVRGKVYFYISFVRSKAEEKLAAAAAAAENDEEGGKKSLSKKEAAAAVAAELVLEKTGILIVDVKSGLCNMFDRSGRTVGSFTGSFLKEGVDTLQAGKTFRVGNRSVETLTAISEESFRTGDFFLRSDHEQRIRETKVKQMVEKIAEEQKAAAKPKITFGAGFASMQFRARPQNTGWVVPVAGRIKDPNGRTGLQIGGDLEPLHDPDAPGAVVLFRADYKRDHNGDRIVSVVVDPVLGAKLRPHQQIGVKFLYDCVTGEKVPGFQGAILADSMGLGKSIQAVSTVYTCLKQGKYGKPITRKAMIVAPSSLCANWGKEFDKWLGPGVVKAFCIAESSPKSDRVLSRFEGEGDVLIISYDQLRKYVDRLKVMRSIDLIVCDEGHRLKNADIKTTKCVDMMPTRRRIVLSGTPIQNDLGEFHAMVGFVNPGILGNIDLFTRVFQEPVMRGREPTADDETRDLGSDRANYLAKMTQKFILRRTQSINEKYLPAKVDMTVFCRLGVEQQATYERVHAMADKFQSAPLVLITALKKLCNHVDLLHEVIKSETSQLQLPTSVLPKGFKPGSVDGTFGSKVEFVSLMLDQLPKYNDKLVIVSNYTQTLDVLARLCQRKNVAFFQLDGNTPIKKRQELVDYFNIPTQREIVFLLSSKAGGVGLNLIGANRLILFDPDWNPANDAQAMGRVWRDGQKKKVFLYRLLCTGTIEEKIYQRQVSKEGLSANVIDMQQDSKQHFSNEDLKALFQFKRDTLCDTHDLLGCKCNVKKEVSASAPTFAFKKVGGKKPEQSGPRMDELKSWQHLENIAGFSLDTCIQTMARQNPRLVSFMFANERDITKLPPEEAPVEEKALQAFESAITCSQDEDPGRPGHNDAFDPDQEELLLGLSQNGGGGGGVMLLDDDE
jgi:superfamily II DNA or RNA helicase